jgi:hypothetical protein
MEATSFLSLLVSGSVSLRVTSSFDVVLASPPCQHLPSASSEMSCFHLSPGPLSVATTMRRACLTTVRQPNHPTHGYKR